MTRIDLDTIPTMAGTYRRALFSRKPGLHGGTIPRIEAHAPNIQINGAAVEAYNRVCGISSGVPASYLHVLATPVQGAIITHRKFPLAALGQVHVRQSIKACRPVESGESFALEVFVEGHHEARAGVEFDLITRYRDRGGELVWEGVTSVLMRERGRPRTRKRKVPIQGDPPGTNISTTWKLGEDLGRQYARVSGDYNPIHLYPATAKLFGFKRAIIQGMWSVARVLGQFDNLVSDRPVTMNTEFKRPILLPARVVFSARDGNTGCNKHFEVRSVDGRTTHLVGDLSVV